LRAVIVIRQAAGNGFFKRRRTDRLCCRFGHDPQAIILRNKRCIAEEIALVVTARRIGADGERAVGRNATFSDFENLDPRVSPNRNVAEDASGFAAAGIGRCLSGRFKRQRLSPWQRMRRIFDAVRYPAGLVEANDRVRRRRTGRGVPLIEHEQHGCARLAYEFGLLIDCRFNRRSGSRVHCRRRCHDFDGFSRLLDGGVWVLKLKLFCARPAQHVHFIIKVWRGRLSNRLRFACFRKFLGNDLCRIGIDRFCRQGGRNDREDQCREPECSKLHGELSSVRRRPNQVRRAYLRGIPGGKAENYGRIQDCV
jgi:hypothetical protein